MTDLTPSTSEIMREYARLHYLAHEPDGAEAGVLADILALVVEHRTDLVAEMVLDLILPSND